MLAGAILSPRCGAGAMSAKCLQLGAGLGAAASPLPHSAQGPVLLKLLFETSQDKEPFKFQTQRYSYRL